MSRSEESLWHGVDSLLDRATEDGIIAHKLGPLAAARWRATGRPVTKRVADEERAASFAVLSAEALLRRIREAGTGPLVLLKGPELAAVYPPGGRRFGDLDVLSPDASGLHRALQQHGFVEVHERQFDHAGHHHLVPLRWPVVPLLVEVHQLPNWPPRIEPPRLAAIFEGAVPSATGIEGLHAPDPLHHSLMLAAHAWRHEPLQSLRDLIDVAAMSIGIDEGELERGARAWGLARVWRSTRSAIEALLFDGPSTAALLIWARHLRSVRERSVFEGHLQRVLAPFWGLPPGPAMHEGLDGLRIAIVPGEQEGWGDKLGRIPRAIRDARVPLSKRPD